MASDGAERAWRRYQLLVGQWRLHVQRSGAGDPAARGFRAGIDGLLARRLRVIIEALLAEQDPAKPPAQRVQEMRLAANWIERHPDALPPALAAAFARVEGAVGKGRRTMDTYKSVRRSAARRREAR